jgi:hypothetical protein
VAIDRDKLMESEWQTPHASTRIRTLPGGGAVSSRSTTSRRPGLLACTAR